VSLPATTDLTQQCHRLLLGRPPARDLLGDRQCQHHVRAALDHAAHDLRGDGLVAGLEAEGVLEATHTDLQALQRHSSHPLFLFLATWRARLDGARAQVGEVSHLLAVQGSA